MSMIEVASPHTARIWLGELPDLHAESTKVIQQSRELVGSSRRSKAAIVAVEVFIPRGARFIYGLLGGEFVPKESNELLVQVVRSQTDQFITDWSLARGLDAVRNVVPPWAVDEILNVALDFGKSQLLGPGSLRFPVGAHGELGSNKWVFRGLVKTIISLMLIDGPHSEERLTSILGQSFV